MISKYVNKIKIKNDVYAIFNNLVMLTIFVNEKQCNDILNDHVDNLTDEEKTEFIKAGIIVENKDTDTKLLNTLKMAREQFMKEHITIMYIIPTNTCNLKCKYCFIGKLNDKPVKMEKSTLIKAIELFNKHLQEINDKGTIFLYGAEPLLNFDLIKVAVEYVKKHNYNIQFSMVSNGILITDEIADFIKDNNISLGISVDGPKEITDENRIFKNGNNSVYDAVLKKINLLKSKKVDFGLSITIAPIFLENENYFLNWIAKLGVYNISYNLLHFTTKTDEWKEYYKKATKFIYKSNKKLFDQGFNEDRINRKYDSFYNRIFKFSDCGAVGGNQITVCPNGDIEICHGYWNYKRKILPNINQIQSFSDLFDNAEYIKWSNNITLNKKKCLRCPAIYICGGGCAMQAKDLFGNEKEIDKPFCIYTKGMLKNILKEVYEDNLNSQN